MTQISTSSSSSWQELLYSFLNEECGVLYTNIDGLINKKDELLKLINDTQPSIVAITEAYPKSGTVPSQAELEIPGFDVCK